MLRLLLCLALLGAAAAVPAGVLTRAELASRFPAPLSVGERERDVPAWPVFKQNGTRTELVGYAFESIDLAPIPGFAGVPVNLLVLIDSKGDFLDVSVLSHHEPVFLDGLGEAPLRAFAAQYKGLSPRQRITIDSKLKRTRAPDAAHAYLDGVSKATASVRIINQSVLSAALKVSRKKLGFAEGRDPDRIARILTAEFTKMGAAQLLAAGMITHVRLTRGQVEQLFRGSAGGGLDADALARPGELFIDLYLAWVSVPTIGRNLLDAASWDKLRGRLDEGDHAMLAMSSGSHSVIGEDFVRGSVSDRLTLRQDSLPVEMRDLDLALTLADNSRLPTENVSVFRIIGQAGLDPAGALDFALPITRSKGIVYPERITREVAIPYRLPASLYLLPRGRDSGWRGIWRERLPELLVLAAALALLAIALWRQQALTADARRFAWLRRAYLLFTLGFIGYFAQGQLSIVTITGVVQALSAGRGLAFLLYDPIGVVLWIFVGASLLLWGRGTFCGWLCPFGALQEFIGKVAGWLGVPQLRLRTRTDARLKSLKYVVLAGVLGGAAVAPALADRLVEVEPFKTAITLAFVRSWPHVLYALGLLGAGMFVYKFFCRYLCPFGAALAVMGRLRRLAWIARRAECGTPCQTCRHRCDYQAIEPGGAVDYAECLQCMDCVVIHASDERCAPRMLEIKRARTIPIVRVENLERGGA
ncbi:4Fe-4S binding protein [Massilia glaciei]|uniref:4Fe-4S binding protein n=1 Tax=Massilia glaciei TaxID=1524097 RepID=A0A2U2I7A1_9BURK|nr:4Fe-4S binding protein [Massilia glaciei]PWF55628.1 4Fe-4S binding protein [Massilia glaciei]